MRVSERREERDVSGILFFTFLNFFNFLNASHSGGARVRRVCRPPALRAGQGEMHTAAVPCVVDFAIAFSRPRFVSILRLHFLVALKIVS